MLAFAANSILCRLALQGGHIDPLSFSSLRLASGAFVLSPFLFYHARTTLSLWRPLSGFYLMAYRRMFAGDINGNHFIFKRGVVKLHSS